MKRIALEPRANWQKRLEDAGCYFHSIDGRPYWTEDAAYVFTAAEIDRIDDAATELHAMCLDYVTDVLQRGDKPDGYGFPDEVWDLIIQSWRTREPGLYGRFDLGYDGAALKMFEYNADTPTALPEAAVWQWHAAEDRCWPDQFNSIHEELVKRWPLIVPDTPFAPIRRLHFTAMRDGQHEDWGNIHYLLETATEAGYDATSIPLEDIGWNEPAQTFRDLNEQPIRLLFKLYPWEWMMADQFGWNVRRSQTRFVEPAWKMLLSSKALLPHLWQRHRGHPLLLEAHFEDAIVRANPEQGLHALGDGMWVRKPILGREGANISLYHPRDADQCCAPDEIGSIQNPTYDKHGYVYQRQFLVPPHNGCTPVLGAWVVGDKACGLGIREDTSVITTNGSRFVPHYFVE